MAPHSLRRTAGVLFLLLALPSWLWGQAWQWAYACQSNTSTGSSSVFDLVPDAAGNFLVVGIFRGTVVLGNTPLTSAGGLDLFVARLSPAGVWSQVLSAGGSGDEFISTVALDNGGNATLVGLFSSPSLLVGTTTLVNADASGSTTDILVARLSSTGTWTQAERAGGLGDDGAGSVVLDGTGGALVSGSFSSPDLRLGTTVLTNADASGTTADIYVARWSSTGQ